MFPFVVMAGDYTFAIKAKDDSGAIMEGFRFAKPMTVTMFFEVPSSVPADQADAYVPKMNLWDTATSSW